MSLSILNYLVLDLAPLLASQFLTHSKQEHKNEQVYKGRHIHNHCASWTFVLSTCHPAHQESIPGDKLIVSNVNQYWKLCFLIPDLMINIQFNHENSLCRERPLFTNLLPSFYMGGHRKQGCVLLNIVTPILLNRWQTSCIIQIISFSLDFD